MSTWPSQRLRSSTNGHLCFGFRAIPGNCWWCQAKKKGIYLCISSRGNVASSCRLCTPTHSSLGFLSGFDMAEESNVEGEKCSIISTLLGALYLHSHQRESIKEPTMGIFNDHAQPLEHVPTIILLAPYPQNTWAIPGDSGQFQVIPEKPHQRTPKKHQAIPGDSG